MKAQKWDCKTRKYYDYDLPKGACLCGDDMDKVIACARCGEKMRFGDGYTSKQIHTEIGLGYAVCEKCYDKEWREEKENAKTNKTT